jgi:hypothetical protein
MTYHLIPAFGAVLAVACALVFLRRVNKRLDEEQARVEREESDREKAERLQPAGPGKR